MGGQLLQCESRIKVICLSWKNQIFLDVCKDNRTGLIINEIQYLGKMCASLDLTN